MRRERTEPIVISMQVKTAATALVGRCNGYSDWRRHWSLANLAAAATGSEPEPVSQPMPRARPEPVAAPARHSNVISVAGLGSSCSQLQVPGGMRHRLSPTLPCPFL